MTRHITVNLTKTRSDFIFYRSQPTLKSRAGHGDDIPPQVRRAALDRSITEIAHVAFVHATARSNFCSDRKREQTCGIKTSPFWFWIILRPSIYVVIYWVWQRGDSPYCTYGVGSRQEWSPCTVLLLGLAWGTAETVHQGGEGRCIELTKGPQGDCVHHKNGRMWVIATRSYFWKQLCGDLMFNNLLRCLDDLPSSSLPRLVFFVGCWSSLFSTLVELRSALIHLLRLWNSCLDLRSTFPRKNERPLLRSWHGHVVVHVCRVYCLGFDVDLQFCTV